MYVFLFFPLFHQGFAFFSYAFFLASIHIFFSSTSKKMVPKSFPKMPPCCVPSLQVCLCVCFPSVATKGEMEEAKEGRRENVSSPSSSLSFLLSLVILLQRREKCLVSYCFIHFFLSCPFIYFVFSLFSFPPRIPFA